MSGVHFSYLEIDIKMIESVSCRGRDGRGRMTIMQNLAKLL